MLKDNLEKLFESYNPRYLDKLIKQKVIVDQQSFDWKEQAKMSMYVNKMERKGYSIYTTDSGDDQHNLYVSKRELTEEEMMSAGLFYPGDEIDYEENI